MTQKLIKQLEDSIRAYEITGNGDMKHVDMLRESVATIKKLTTQKRRLRRILRRIMGRTGLASDHVSCYECYDSGDEAKQVLRNTAK